MLPSKRFALLIVAAALLTVSACTSPKHPRDPLPQKMEDTREQSGTSDLAPSGFDIRVFAEAGQADSLQHAVLITEVDIPTGSYVISALSDRDYLGKFQVIWEDSTIRPAGALIENPISMPGWEPFDQVYTPMLFENTELRQEWALPKDTSAFEGQVFFVLEPQCVPYALDFTLEKEEMGWSTSYGIVHAAYPED